MAFLPAPPSWIPFRRASHAFDAAAAARPFCRGARVAPRSPAHRRRVVRAAKNTDGPVPAPSPLPTSPEPLPLEDISGPPLDDILAGQTADAIEEPSRAANLAWVAGWVGVAAATAAGVFGVAGPELSLEFVTAYVVEYCLSVDNLFVFLLLFQYFKVPRDVQPKVLNYGVYGAMAMRLVFIVTGVELEKHFWWVSLAFALILIGSAVKILTSGDDEEEDLSDNGTVQLARKLVSVTDKYVGSHFWTLENGKRVATPLLLCLVTVELSDVVFAFDSVPACLAISKSTFVVYCSNVLAILGLRSLFFVIEDALNGLRFLQPSLAFVLGFVGCKMAAQVAGFEVGIAESLTVVLGILGGGVGLSLAFPQSTDTE